MKLCCLFLAVLMVLHFKMLYARAVNRLRKVTNSGNDLGTVNCGTEMREMCSNFVQSHNFSLKVSSSVYIPGQEIKVKVFMTQCPSIELQGPKWYQLEVITNTSDHSKTNVSYYVGEFYPIQNHVHFCDQRTRVVFTSCDPQSFDLPVNYIWITPSIPSGEICFRLTVQQEEGSCEEEKLCIGPAESSSPDLDYSPDNILESGSGNDFDYNTMPPSTGILQVKSSPSPITSMCHSDRESMLSYGFEWIPHCSCTGYYEPVQCWEDDGQLECWCSTKILGNSIGSRRRISCTDPSELDLDCS